MKDDDYTVRRRQIALQRLREKSREYRLRVDRNCYATRRQLKADIAEWKRRKLEKGEKHG